MVKPDKKSDKKGNPGQVKDFCFSDKREKL
jgi:hypothetical protein